MLKFSDVVMPPKSPDLQNILEFWEPLEYFAQVFILKTVVLTTVANSGDVFVLVNNLENKTDVTEVTAILKN
jgi:hypothetical protein